MHSNHNRVKVLIDIEAFLFWFMLGFVLEFFVSRRLGRRSNNILFHNVTILLILFISNHFFSHYNIASWCPSGKLIFQPIPTHTPYRSSTNKSSSPSASPKTPRLPPQRHLVVAIFSKAYNCLTQKLFEVATSSKSQIFMTVFMFWMFGNNISIFVLFPIIQTLTTAVSGLLNMQKGKHFTKYSFRTLWGYGG